MKGGKGFSVSTALVLVLLVVVGGMAYYIISTRNAAPAEEPKKRNYVVNEENIDEVVEQMTTAPKRAASYTAKMNSDWHFPDGKSPSADAYVANSADNTWPVWFDVKLSDGRTVYESPILPVDTYVRNFALDEDLDEGIYGAAVTYHLVDEDQNELTTVSVNVTIYVEG